MVDFDESFLVQFQIVAGEIAADFVNTLDNRPVPERLKELLPNYQDLADWARQAGAISDSQCQKLLGTAVEQPKKARDVLHKAVMLRECLFRVFSAVVTERKPSPEDLHLLNAFVGEAMSQLRLHPRSSAMELQWNETDPLPLDFPLWPVIRSAVNLLTSPDLVYLRQCGADACRWLFVDRSKNHSRRWCDMKICGNRMKAQSFYRRQRTPARGRKTR